MIRYADPVRLRKPAPRRRRSRNLPFLPSSADGFGFSQIGQNSMGTSDAGPLKQQIVGMLHAATYMRMPLVVTNIVVIVLKLLIG